MQEEINRQREIHNRVLVRDPVTQGVPGRLETGGQGIPSAGDGVHYDPVPERGDRNAGGRFQASAKNETEKTDAVVTGGKKYVCKTD